jgi:NAD(P)-dependent dehydrogenase (short-subunit alcohol dehydrogenase family)
MGNRFGVLVGLANMYAFDVRGYRRHARRFVPGALDVDMTGRVCLVTGANGGIGKAVARALAERGADVHLLCRSRERAEPACKEIREQARSTRVFLEQMDVASLDSVRAFCARFQPSRVDVLVHNAGLIPPERTLTADGLELTLATHVVGPYLLTRLLEPRLRAAAAARAAAGAPERGAEKGGVAAASPGRVVFVSSGGMYSQILSLDDIEWTRRKYDGVAAYAQTKRMQVVLAEELAALWPARESVCHAMHPGWAHTPGLESSLPNLAQWIGPNLRTPEEGADTVVWLAVAGEPARTTGRFWFDRRVVRTHFLGVPRSSRGARRALMALCERYAPLGSDARTP